MLTAIDTFLNTIPMYRATLYFVASIWVAAIGLGFLGMLPYGGAAIALSGVFLVLVSWIANEVFAWGFSAPVNHESAYITGLILALIVSPAASASGLISLAVVAVVAIGSKFILAIRGKHLFNPAAVAVVLTSVVGGISASWWVATAAMLPFVVIGGFLLTRKVAREDLVYSYIATALVVGTTYYLATGLAFTAIMQHLLVSSALIFMGTVMLTEPMTTPPTRKLRIVYGELVGFLFLPFVHIGSFSFTPELALVVGNIFVYLVSPKLTLTLSLLRIDRLSNDLYDFVFAPNREFQFRAGQYLEWTMGDVAFNTKGNRRYFTIASAPTEREIRVGVRMQEPLSEFKREMLLMKAGDEITASQLSGDFVLPKKANKKFAFIAGGIGITPFRSMVKQLIDTNDRRPATLFYAGRTPEDLVYKDVFNDARERIGFKTVYTVSDPHSRTGIWGGSVGRIDAALVKKEMPDYKERTFYISGSHTLVGGMRKMLLELGVSRSSIHTDYFPGIV